jgi:DNA (cytosine-5)-methyltransferase 1
MMGLIVDLFAGGGGASEGIRMSLGRDPDIAINHSPDAVAMHAANHPGTRHLTNDVWRVPPLFATGGQPVDLLWASPDCKDFSKAKGGKPRSRKIRDLAWVVVDWARKANPRVIILENVEEFRGWGPLDAKGRRIKELEGQTFDHWVRSLRAYGYHVEWRELRACDYGAPTTRKRLFLIARRDGQPLTWPEPTHGPGLMPYHTAGECIDWSIPCPSIFLDREGARELRRQTGIMCKRPLAENTMARIAKGTWKYVIQAAEPFIVTYYGPKSGGVEFRGQGLGDPLKTKTTYIRHGLVVPFIQHVQHSSLSNGTMPGDEPLRTITSYPKGGGMALVSAFLAKHYTGVTGQEANSPLGTITGIDHHSLVAAHLVRHFGRSVGQSPGEPAPTTTSGGGGKTGLVTSHMVKLKGSNIGQDAREPLQTITAGGCHFGEVRAFLMKYYGQGCGQDLNEPAHTLTAKERFGLVTVAGEDYAIFDIGMRMLSPRELFTAQGFHADYIIDRGVDGKRLTKEAQVSMVGNSVSPPNAAALVAANCSEMARAAA